MTGPINIGATTLSALDASLALGQALQGLPTSVSEARRVLEDAARAKVERGIAARVYQARASGELAALLRRGSFTGLGGHPRVTIDGSIEGSTGNIRCADGGGNRVFWDAGVPIEPYDSSKVPLEKLDWFKRVFADAAQHFNRESVAESYRELGPRFPTRLRKDSLHMAYAASVMARACASLREGDFLSAWGYLWIGHEHIKSPSSRMADLKGALKNFEELISQIRPKIFEADFARLFQMGRRLLIERLHIGKSDQSAGIHPAHFSKLCVTFSEYVSIPGDVEPECEDRAFITAYLKVAYLPDHRQRQILQRRLARLLALGHWAECELALYREFFLPLLTLDLTPIMQDLEVIEALVMRDIPSEGRSSRLALQGLETAKKHLGAGQKNLALHTLQTVQRRADSEMAHTLARSLEDVMDKIRRV